MPYLPTLDLNAGGCKIAVDGSTALSTAIFYLKFYKNTKIQRENNSPFSSPFETLTLTLAQTSSPRTLARILALAKILECHVVEREEEEERKKEEEEKESKKEEEEEEEESFCQKGRKAGRGRRVF